MQHNTGYYFKKSTIIPYLVLVPIIILSFSDMWAYDESWTYVNTIGNTPGELIAYSKYKIANHHVLNSLYFRWLQELGIKSIFFYRLLSLLTYFLYILFITKLLYREEEEYKPDYWGLAALYLWPYTIYFGQGRGYALAMVSLLMALYYMKTYLKSANQKHLLYFILAGSISSLSIFSFCFPFIAMMIILGLYRFMEIVKSPVRILIFALYLPVLYYVFDKGKVISEYDLNIIGADSLFKGGTLSSLISFMGLLDFVDHKYFMIFKIALTATLLPVLFIMIRRGKLYLEILVALVTIALLVVSHVLFGSQYPLFRGTAYILIMLYLSIVYTNRKGNIFVKAHLAVVSIVGVIYLGILISFMMQKNDNDVLNYVAEHGSNKILVEDVHPATNAYDIMYHDNKIDLVQCEDDAMDIFERNIDSVNFIVCKAETAAEYGIDKRFEPIYPVARFFECNKIFYMRKE
ncbi:MAG: hypothetical protein H6551_08375 [Chitinophagales bacterium]|nr:hypothetical protein [Chitinophagaceae bacterium]MCB9065138.1 hypothetical protein [Chitinophagales bacterium]